jgi:YD repeat-containing protein
VEYADNDNGQRASLTARVGTEVFTTLYGYDSLGRLNAVTDPNSGTYGMTYDGVGRMDTLCRPNGVDTSYAHDDRHRLTHITRVNTATNATVASYAYTLGAGDLRDAITEADGTC